MSAGIDCTKVSIVDAKRWEHLLFSAVNTSYRASMLYEYAATNQFTESYIFHRDGLDIGGVRYSVKQFLFGLIKIADLRSGIVLIDNSDEKLIKYIIDHFEEWAKGNKVSYIRINPWIPASIDGVNTNYLHLFPKIFMDLGFKVIIPGRYTYWLDLTLTEEQMINNMRRDTKYRIKQGIKSDIEVVRYDKADNDIILQFWTLYSILGNKKKFSTLSIKKFKNQVNTLLKNDLACLFVAKFHGVIVNISLASKVGIATYLLGAINPDFKNLVGCPSPGHVTQWEMIKTMKKFGYKIYDLGFCPGFIPNPNHPRYPIWRFKYGFGGKHVQYLPTYGKVIKSITGRVFQLLKYRI